jgi:DNA-binding protein YbaB
MDQIGIDQLIRDLQQRMGGLRDYQEGAASITGLGQAAEGRVRATVAPGGVVRCLDIDPRAMRLGSQMLAEALLEAIRLGTQDADQQLAELGREAAGPVQAFTDAAGMRGELDQMVADLNRNLGQAQYDLEAVLRKLHQR